MTPERVAFMRRRLEANQDCSGLFLIKDDRVKALILTVPELAELLSVWEKSSVKSSG